MYGSLAVCLNYEWTYILFQTHLTFGREFTEAVEMKQVAQQDAERARYIVERVSVINEGERGAEQQDTS